MALKGIAPTAVQKRLKCMMFGPAGVGKTTAAIQFPKPYLIDTERGAENEQYARLLAERGGVIFQSPDFDEMVAEVLALMTEAHEYRTLIIDPITVVYNDLLEKAEIQVGTDFGRHYGEANKRMRHLINLVLRLDMNVIVTAHGKTMYGDNLAVMGQTFDGWKKLDYIFDLVFELQRRGNERVGVVRKTRITEFPEGDVFPFTYDEIADRYGRAMLERDAAPVALATPDQIEEVTRLLEMRRDGDDLREKWCAKANAETLAEMPAETIAKCIAWLNNGKDKA
jgi:RecA/RadA recombinase